MRFSLTTCVITYAYQCAASLKRSERDKLYRLTDADYRSTGLTAGSSGESFAYGYDAVGSPVSTREFLRRVWTTPRFKHIPS